MSNEKTLFERLGGRPTLEKVHKIFYDKLYVHPWFSLFFKHVEQKVQEAQVTDFMTEPMGGGSIYSGAFPVPAHMHIYITDELFDLRHELLKESLNEAGIPAELQSQWLRIDRAFKAGIVKKSKSDCKPRFATDEIVDIPDPRKKAA